MCKKITEQIRPGLVRFISKNAGILVLRTVLCADIFAQILRLIFVGIATTTTIIEGFTGATNDIEIIHGLESFTWSWLW